MKQKVLTIMQARMSSTRLPGKVLKEVNGTSLLAYELARLKRAKTIDKIVVATSSQSEDDVIEKLCKAIGVDVFRGSLEDVLLRYATCAKKYPEYQVIVRVTGDCPLIDPLAVDCVVSFFLAGEFDYVSNVPLGKETFPDGMDVEVFSRNALEEAAEKAISPSEHEHVTPYIRNNPNYRHGEVFAEQDNSAYRLTVDNPEDFEVVKFLIEQCAPEAGYLEYIEVLNAHPEVLMFNTHILRNEGYQKSLVQEGLTRKS
jgi:spore coat polysaccharide biosynthesis protein SpsF